MLYFYSTVMTSKFLISFGVTSVAVNYALGEVHDEFLPRGVAHVSTGTPADVCKPGSCKHVITLSHRKGALII